jgi:hypothetical protein
MKILLALAIFVGGAYSASACIACAYNAARTIAHSPALSGMPVPAQTTQKSKGKGAPEGPSAARRDAAFGGSVAPNPADWKPSEQQRIPDANFEMQHVTGNAWLSVMSQQDYSPHGTFLDAFQSSITSENPQATSEPRFERTVKGTKFTLMRVNLPVQGLTMTMLVAVTSNKFGSFQLVFMTNADLYDDYLPDFMNVLDTYNKPA